MLRTAGRTARAGWIVLLALVGVGVGALRQEAQAQVPLQQIQAAADSASSQVRDRAALEEAARVQAPDEQEKPGSALQFLAGLFHISAKSARAKAQRIGIVFLIGLLAKLFMDGVKWLSRLLISTAWGPFRYLFRNRKRAVTIHGLVISLLKYVVYFTAFGYILSELGINYQTYLASLSLIGIAVGFGAQGLVQDVVTGFFIIFEDQFGVGDMVEISGQVGVIEDLGLRTTRLRNYLGALIIFQNRNIPMAVNYPRGMEVVVDVAIPDPGAAPRAAALLGRIGAEMERQFREVILEPPRVRGLVALETGECFVRLYARIWPQQQWVVETQMAPRIREGFAREGIEIPQDRVVIFHHLPDGESAAAAPLGPAG